MTPPRCPWAINFGGTLHTRCMLDNGHATMHTARGLAQFEYQRINWLPYDRRSYETDRTDESAWEGSYGRLVDGKWVMP